MNGLGGGVGVLKLVTEVVKEDEDGEEGERRLMDWRASAVGGLVAAGTRG